MEEIKIKELIKSWLTQKGWPGDSCSFCSTTAILLVLNNKFCYIHTAEDSGLESDNTGERCNTVADNHLSLLPVQLWSWEPRTLKCLIKEWHVELDMQPVHCGALVKIITSSLQFCDFKIYGSGFRVGETVLFLKISLTPFCTTLDILQNAAGFSQDKAEGLVCLQK